MSGWGLSVARPEFLWLTLLALPMVALAWRSARRLRPLRLALVLSLRLLLLLSLVAATAELNLKRPVDDLAVVFVLDRSASVGAQGLQEQVEFVRAALGEQEAHDQAAVVVFGAEAAVERELQESLRFDEVESVPSAHASDLEAGVRLGTALLPADRTRRLVLLSDGEQTRGDVAGLALLAAGDDLEISVVEVGDEGGPEALLEDLIAPTQVDQGATYEVKVVARSEVEAPATLRLFRNQRYLGELKVQLPAGRARVFSFKQVAGEAGLARYRATLEVEAAVDSLPENNQVITTVQVAGRPRLLLVDTDPTDLRFLKVVFEGGGFDVDVVGAERLPSDLSGLRRYQAVFLSNVPSYAMSRPQQRALQSYVRDLGRGLVMIGGEQSFGVGGWYQTPVEEALPVRMDLEDKTRFPSLAMVLALDKSGSMGGGGGSKLEMAKEAVIQTADLLSARDHLGVISFDGASSWISPLAPLTDPQRVRDDIAALRAGGGTDIYPALDTAIGALRETDTALKHIILVSDGMTSAGAYQPLIQGAFADGITLTTIGVGTDADRQTLRDFASWGGGSYYLVTNKNAIPAIFTREAMLATRSFLVEEPFTPIKGASSPLSRGVEALPQLEGFVATEAKPRSTVALWSPDPEGDLPLLAHWRYGLGRSVAFTSDATARWSHRWVSEPSYTKLWTQVARWVAADGTSGNLDVNAEIQEGQLVITADVMEAGGGFHNFLHGAARVVAPDLEVVDLPLEQVAPGRYEGRMPVHADGSWLAGVQLVEGEQLVAQAVVEAVQPYSPEYRTALAGGAVLTEVARVGGGAVLTDPLQVFRRPEVARQVPRPLWPWLMALGAVLLLLDVASRRLDLSRGGRSMGVVAPAQGGARFRWAQGAPPSGAEVGAEAAAVEHAEVEVQAPEAPEVPEESYAGRLLAARKKARRRIDE